jgi:hypothetical protein
MGMRKGDSEMTDGQMRHLRDMERELNAWFLPASSGEPGPLVA